MNSYLSIVQKVQFIQVLQRQTNNYNSNPNKNELESITNTYEKNKASANKLHKLVSKSPTPPTLKPQ